MTTWKLARPSETCRAGRHRVVVDVAGEPLWFESSDTPLVPSLDCFVAALLLPALRHRAKLVADDGLDPLLRQGLEALVEIYAEWWHYRRDVTIDLRAADPSSGPPAAGVAQCFTGGVDSFYSLLSGEHSVDTLVFVHGFDIPLGDQQRWQHAEQTLRQVGAKLGKRTLVLRTNLREHPVSRGVNWERAHGAALAAAGHALAGCIGTLIIPPSFRVDRLRPWGSDPRTDSLYSSTHLSVRHPACELGRVARLEAIATHPLVQQHLRVCFENRAPHGNCSRCEKCVAVMTVLAGLGQGRNFAVFDPPSVLVDRIDQLPYIRHHARVVWQDIEALDHTAEVRAAVTRLLERRGPPWWRRVRRRWERWWTAWRGTN